MKTLITALSVLTFGTSIGTLNTVLNKTRYLALFTRPLI